MYTPKRSVILFGSTGSVGRQAVDVLSHHLDTFEVRALVAHKDVQRIAAQARLLKPERVVLRDASTYGSLKDALRGTEIEICAGEEAFLETATLPCDWALSAVSGFAGLQATYALLKSCRTLALANKESLVTAGGLILERAHTYGVDIIPVDSELWGIFQTFDWAEPENIEEILLTASGGPFGNRPLCDLHDITPEQAIAHPNWSMGHKISIDSATLMNKGLELIEVHRFFDDFPEDRIRVTIHPESFVHGGVRYRDGSLILQATPPDMRGPIAYALFWPNRSDSPLSGWDWGKMQTLSFHVPDEAVRFRALSLARQAIREHKEIAFNAANECAVEAFVQGRLHFTDIVPSVEETLSKDVGGELKQLEDVYALDQRARNVFYSNFKLYAA